MAAEPKSARKSDERASDNAVQHIKNARREVMRSWEAFLPPGFVEHSRAARKEMLLAFRDLLDAAARRLDEEETAR